MKVTGVQTGIFLAFFTADWCNPCRESWTVYNDLQQQFKNDVNFIVIDIDKHPKIAENYNVVGIPAFLIFKGETVEEVRVGTQPLERMTNLLIRHLKKV